MINRELSEREIELVRSIRPASFFEIVEEVRELLPPTKTMRTRYMRAYQGLAVF